MWIFRGRDADVPQNKRLRLLFHSCVCSVFLSVKSLSGDRKWLLNLRAHGLNLSCFFFILSKFLLRLGGFFSLKSSSTSPIS